MLLSLFVNDVQISVDSRLSVLQACEMAGFVIPRFCYHERLSVAGNCRMCLVEIEKAPKLSASCAIPLMPGMRIKTNTPAVRKAREGVLEFLLINHPLDCPICDQGGECDLQDQVMVYGSDRGRFREYKRAIEDKNCGPIVKTIMTRCIQCTRCIRFANEIAGVSDFGTSGRGNQIEIGTYVDKLLKSEFSGNLIDLCPVGALTSKPYAFAARSWELKSIESIDTLDAVCSNIRVDIRGYEILRVLPSTNEELNESWLNDKSRFSFDGLKRQRLCDPLLRRNGGFVQISWLEAFNVINDKLKTSKPQINGLVGPQADLESSFMLKILLSFFGKTNILNNNYNMLEHTDFESSYKFNSKIKGIENCDVCVLIGVDPRKEASILNLKLRKHYLNSNFKVANFGSVLNLTFPCLHLGSSSTDILKFTKGQHLFCETFKKATQPYIIFGSSFFKILNEESARSIITVISKNTRILYKDSFGFNFLSFQASQVGSFDLGLSTNNIYSKPTLMYAVGDAIIPSNVSKTSFVVYQGHQGNLNALKADLILPGSAYTEKDCIFINTEGRAQKTQKIVPSPGKSKNDASVLSALINFISKQKIVVNLKLLEIENYNLVFNAFFTDRQTPVNGVFKNSVIISSKVNNFYLSDSISKASPTMAKCSKQLLSKDSLLI